jgi:large subunit ribosomal protein L9
VQTFLQTLIASAPNLARAMPGIQRSRAGRCRAGLGLAPPHRAWPLGEAPAAFRTFRFSDHWCGVLSLRSLCWWRCYPEVTVLAENLLILWVGLYALRGLAIAVAALAAAPAPLRVLPGPAALLLSPLTLGVCLAMGLADTWLGHPQRRRRLPGGRKMIEVILREDVHRWQGQPGPRQARLRPQLLLRAGLAYEATEGNKKRIAAETRARGVRAGGARQGAGRGRAALARWRDHRREGGRGERLFGPVTAQDIADALERAGHPIDKRKLELPHPIKQLGEHTVPVRLHAEVQAAVRVTVVPE